MKRSTIGGWWQKRYNEDFFSYFLSHISASNISVTELETKQIIRIISKHFKNWKNIQILDVGGGFGRHAINLINKGVKSVVVLDQSVPFLEIGKFLTSTFGLNKNIQFIHGDAYNLRSKFKNHKFPVVLCLGNSILGYSSNTDNDIKFLKNIKSVLKEGGIFILDIQSQNYLRDTFLKPLATKVSVGKYTIYTKRHFKNTHIHVSETVKNSFKVVSTNNFKMQTYKEKQIFDMFYKTKFKSVSNGIFFRVNQDLGTMSKREVYVATK